MIEQYTIARPYAKAVFSLAQQAHTFDAWSEFFLVFNQIIEEFSGVPVLHTGLSSDRRIALLQDISKMPLSQEQENLLKLLLRRKRAYVLKQIAELYEEMRADYEGKATAKVIAARELTDAQQQKILRALQKKFKREIILEQAVDVSLIGGAIIHIAGQVIDGSIAGWLQRIKEKGQKEYVV